jgi:hypothetical protein
MANNKNPVGFFVDFYFGKQTPNPGFKPGFLWILSTLVTVRVWACMLPNCSLRTENCATFTGDTSGEKHMFFIMFFVMYSF